MLSSNYINKDQIANIASDLLDQPVDEINLFRSGFNSEIYQVRSDKKNYALKFYSKNDGYDRLQRESNGFRYLRSHNIACVPAVISADYDHFCALYEWIDGSHIKTPSGADVDGILEFCANLFQLGKYDSALLLKEASASCFSGQSVIRQLRERLLNLQNIDTAHVDLDNFLEIEFLPVLLVVEEKSKQQYIAEKISFDTPITISERVLNPSDLGFHNALHRNDGTFIFLDFEYFGWDDPVKLTADVLLHPAMELNEILKRRFLAGAENIFGKSNEQHFRMRFNMLYPLFGLIWCLILLNTFLPSHTNNSTTKLETEKHDEALLKAKRLLTRIQKFHEYGRKFI